MLAEPNDGPQRTNDTTSPVTRFVVALAHLVTRVAYPWLGARSPRAFRVDAVWLRLFASALEKHSMSEATRSVREPYVTIARRRECPRTAMLGALLVLLACVACGSAVQVKAERSPSYAGQVHSLYLVIVQGGLNKDYADRFVDSFQREMARRKVTLSSRVVAGTDLDRQLVYNEVAASHADAALLVRSPHGPTHAGEVASLTWDVSLFDAKSGSTVWHAQVENKNTAEMTQGMVEDTAVGIVEHLYSDHLFGSGS